VLIDWIRKLREYLRITGGDRISRRYFVMNSFDGVVTILGVLVGALTTGVTKPEIIIGISVGTTIGMMISGFSGTFIAEKAEREIDLANLKHALLVKDLKGTIYERAIKATVWWVSFVDAISPLISGIIALIPEILALYSFLDEYTAIFASISVILIFLFVLGVYLSKITNKNLLKGGLTLLLVGIGTTLVIIFLLGGIKL